jgi:hypothetical protein
MAEPNKKASISGSKSETSEQSKADWNNRNKNRKRCNIITVPPTNSPCPHGLTVHTLSSCRLLSSHGGISPSSSIGMLSIEIHFEVEVLVALFQNLWAIIQTDIICILPGVVLFRKPIPVEFKLELIAEPMSIDVLLHDPEVLVIDHDRQQSRLLLMWDCIRGSLGKDVNMEYTMNLPFCG